MSHTSASLPDRDAFSGDTAALERSLTNGIRVAYAIAGVVALILGAVLLIWPEKTVAVVAAIIGIYFVVTGVVKLALGIFSRGIGGGQRAFDIFLGALLLILGIFALRNLTGSSAALLILIVTLIGIGWILDGIFAIVESGASASRGWAISYGIIGILAGLFILLAPAWSITVLILYGGIVLIVLGVVGVIRAFTFGRDAEVRAGLSL